MCQRMLVLPREACHVLIRSAAFDLNLLHHVLQPEETVHPVSRTFYENEVFKTGVFVDQ